MSKRIHVYFRNDDLVKWLKEQVEKGRYRSLSHAIEKSVEAERRRSISY